ncbi:MAG: alpha-amylase family glycosyl hydrolase [Saprospiraceae bacterium]
MTQRLPYRSQCIALFCCLFLGFACKKDAPTRVSLDRTAATAITGVATPIQLNEATTEIILADYFLEPQMIDSINVKGKTLTAVLTDNKEVLKLTTTGSEAYLSNLTFHAKGVAYDILAKKSLRQKAVLAYDAPARKKITNVQIVGDLNNWNPATTPMTKEGNRWVANLSLNPGRYPYKFVVDDVWVNDPANQDSIGNGMGGFNSLLIVEKPSLASLPFLYTKSAENGIVKIGFTNPPTGVLAYYQNHLLETKLTDNELEIIIPKVKNVPERSYLRVYAYNDQGLSNDLKIPLSKGKVLRATQALNRMDTEAMIMYFALVDRFNNGDTQNDDPVKDKRLLPIQNYMGGDIKGITNKIKEGYFKKLGMNTIWLSPITQNPYDAYQEYPAPQRWYSGYHGYWPISSSKIDYRFGKDEDLFELVKVAHDNEMNVLLDFICNHVHEEHPIYKKHPEWATALDLPNGKKNIRIWDEQRLTTWFDTFLPSLDLSNPEVIKTQADSAFFWIKKFGLDGYRHDATKHVPEEFWRHLTKKIKEEIIIGEGRPVYQIGETFGSNELIASYINSGQMDAQFDFNLHFTARDVFAKDGESLLNIANSMRESFDYFGYHATMGNITGNHDLPRFMGLASGSVAFDEDQKEAGYQRDIQVKDKRAYQKLANMNAFLMSIPGIPVIYYGDEIGMVGAGDPDNRRMMRFENWSPEEKELQEKTTALINARKNSLALLYGDTYMLQTEKEVLVYARVYFDEVVIVAFNQGAEKEITVNLPNFLQGNYQTSFGNATLGAATNTLQLSLPQNSFEYFKKK